MSREQVQQRLQELAAKAREIIDEMVRIAHENEITSVPFLGGSLQFGVRFNGPSSFSQEGEIQHLSGYVPAVGGAVVVDYEWSASHFECWPTDDQRTWLFGEDRRKWPRTDYEID